MFENENLEGSFLGFDSPQHPQHDILKFHIERCVQDIFLDALRTQPDELCYVFETEEQIETFIKRVLTYWEEIENFEICQEVLGLSEKFRDKWKNREFLAPNSNGINILEIFGSNLK